MPASPRHIVLTFSEAPDVKLSLVRVLDGDGAAVPGVSAPQAVPGDKQSLRVTPSTPLADGTYTVNWRVVSAVDGHVESGAFAFGVGQAAGEAVVVELLHTSPWAQALADAGRWLLYAALVVLIGAASTSLFVYGGKLPPGGMVVLKAAAAAGVVALGMLVWAEKVLVGAPSLLPLFLTREGQYLLALGVALLLCIGAVVARRPVARPLEPLGARCDRGRRRPGPRPRGARRFALVGVAAQRRRPVGAHGRGRRLGRRPVLAAARPARPRPRAARRGRRSCSPASRR